MRLAKKRPVSFTAFQLGTDNPLEKELIQAGQIRLNSDGNYEVFSREVKNGKGELAKAGDYLKIDSGGYPYPNDREFFEKSCIRVGENRYQQNGTPVEVWFADDPVNDTISFLLHTNRLRLNQDSDDQYFRADLWGAPLSAARNAAVIVHSVTRDPQGRIADVDFYFIERGEFERTYEWC